MKLNLQEVGKLLTIIASFDNRKLDESTAMAWKMMLDREVPDATLAQAQEVVLDWFATENPYFTVSSLCDGLRREMRRNRQQVAADVRSAKARGLVDKYWPESKPLDWMTANSLAAHRLAERTEALALESGDDSIPVTENPLGLEVGRAV